MNKLFCTIEFNLTDKCYTLVYGEDAGEVTPPEKREAQVKCFAENCLRCPNPSVEQVDDLTWKINCV